MTAAKRCAVAILAVGLLSGCSAGASGISDATSIQMQAAVKAIAVSASRGDFPAAAVELDDLQSRLDRALAAGEVGGDRGAQIQSSIDQVRADLGTLVRPVPTPTVSSAPSPAPAPTSTAKGKPKGKGKD